MCVNIVKVCCGVAVSGKIPGELCAEQVHPLTIISFDQELQTLAFLKSLKVRTLLLAVLHVLEDSLNSKRWGFVGSRVRHFDETFGQLRREDQCILDGG